MITATIQKTEISFQYEISHAGEILAKGFSKVFAYDTIRKILYLDAYFYNVSEIKTELKPYETTADGWKFF